MGQKTVTIKDVARDAGVSIATVSRALNGNVPVNKKTKKSIDDSIKRLGYIPNISARNLRKNSTRVVAVISGTFASPYYNHIIRGIFSACVEEDLRMIYVETHDDTDQAHEAFRMLERGQVDAAIFTNPMPKDRWLRDYAGRFPIIQLSEYVEDIDIPIITTNHHDAFYELVQHLLKIGHRRVAFIGADNDYISSRLREQGYKDALIDFGVPIDERLIVSGAGDYNFRSGYEACGKLLALKEKPTAICCVCDMIAMGALLAVQEEGIHVPGDISICGCDDVDYTQMTHPFLTTVTIPCYNMGYKALKEIAGELSEESTPEKLTVMPSKITYRESVARLNL